MLLTLVAIIIFIKIKFHFCHKLLISAWRRGRFPYLLAEEEGFVSVGFSLVQPSWEPHGLHSFPFHLHWGVSRSEPPTAGWGKNPRVSVQSLAFLSGFVATEAVFTSSSCPEETLCAVSRLPCHSCRAEAEMCRARAEPGAGARRCRGSAHLQPHPNASSHTSQMGLAVPGMQLSCSRCKSTSGGLECLSGFVLEWLMLSPIFLSLLNTLLLGMVSKIDVAI